MNKNINIDKILFNQFILNNIYYYDVVFNDKVYATPQDLADAIISEIENPETMEKFVPKKALPTPGMKNNATKMNVNEQPTPGMNNHATKMYVNEQPTPGMNNHATKMYVNEQPRPMNAPPTPPRNNRNAPHTSPLRRWRPGVKSKTPHTLQNSARRRLENQEKRRKNLRQQKFANLRGQTVPMSVNR